MADTALHSQSHPMDGLPIVQLELRHGKARPAVYALTEPSFVIGTVAGCDLRLPVAGMPPVIGLLSRQPDGVLLRKLAPAQSILHNNQATNGTYLAHGDKLTIGPVELICHIQMPERPALPIQAHGIDADTARQLQDQRRQLEDQARELESDRVLWYRRKEELERECQELRQTIADESQHSSERDRELSHLSADLEQREEAVEQQRQGLDQLQRDLEAREERLVKQKQEVESVKVEFNTLRQQLYERYRERRDRLAGLQEAVNHAARKVQDRKREVDSASQENAIKEQELTAREAQLQQFADEVNQARQQVDEKDRQLETQKQDLAQAWTDLQARQQKLTEEEQSLAASQAQHQTDLVRLDRLAAHLEVRQKQLQDRALEIDNRAEEQARTSRDLDEQARELDQWQERLTQETEALAQQRVELEAKLAELAPRAAALESQQAMLATLRTRLEKMREDVRREAQWLAEQRSRHEQSELELQGRLEEEQRLRNELTAERQAFEDQKQRFEERGALLEQAVVQLRQVEQKLGDQEADLRKREDAVGKRGAEQDEQFSVLQVRTTQIAEMQQKLEADRQALKEREEGLTRAEQAREALQEQLRKRSEDLQVRQKALADQIRLHEEAAAQLQQELAAATGRRGELDLEQKRMLEGVEQRAKELEHRQAELEAWNRKLEITTLKIKDEAAETDAARHNLEEEMARWRAEQQQVLSATQKSQVELDACREEAAALQRQLPEMELQAKEAADRLAQAREQLREHLAEMHGYARQGHEDMQSLRNQIAGEADQVRQQEQTLVKARHEHRLAVAGFRQQLIEWQGQITQMKRTIATGETRLQFRQAEVDEKAKKIDLTSARLARQAEELTEQQKQVTQRRGQVEKHLVDMREWYRSKLKELAENKDRDSTDDGDNSEPGSGSAAVRTLAMTGEIDGGDRKLGELLRSLELVDGETLSSLLVEARRQKRSLRHVLLATGCLTFYQLALIEGGNLDALVLGPTRVIDRLRVTPKEAVFRVYDPRRSREGILRHLTETEAAVPGRSEEFRHRFAQVVPVQHPHVAATFEVFDVAGRPAVLQESTTGLASCDWPALAAVPGVWFRLLSQAAVGIQAAHQAHVMHGHLHAGLILLTADGTVKLCGFGEPHWLAEAEEAAAATPDVASDLAALGRIAAGWSVAGRARGSRARPLPEALQTILYRLQSSGPDRLTDAAALLEALDKASGDVPANPEAWDRLLRHVRDQVAVDSQLRLSA